MPTASTRAGEAQVPADPLGDERDPDFRRLWAAQTVSMAGTAVTDVALPLSFVALHASSFEFGVLFAFKTGPRLFAPLFAAPIADGFLRRPVLITCDVVRCVALATVPIAALLGVLGKPQLYAVALLLGVCEVIALTASRAYLPSLVRRDALVGCNGRLEAGIRVSGSVVPGLAGLLIKLVAAPVTMAIDALSYIASALLLGSIRRTEPPVERGATGFAAQLAEGWRAVFADPVLRSVVISLGALNFGIALLYTQLTHYLADVLHLGSAMVGVAVAATSAGALVGSFVRSDGRWGARGVLAAGVLGVAAGGAVQAAAGAALDAHIAIVACFLVGLGSTVFLVYNVTMRQVLTPMRLHGRVNAAAITLGPGLWPIGAVVGGFLGERLGLRAMFVGDVGYLALVAIWVLISPIRHYAPPKRPTA